MPQARRFEKHFVTILLLFEACALIAREISRRYLLQQGFLDITAKDLSYLAVPLSLAVLCYPLLKPHREYLRSLFTVEGLDTRLMLRAIVAGIFLYIAFSYLHVLVFALKLGLGASIIDTESARLWGNCNPATSLALGILAGSILTPVVEEIINRGFLLPAFLHRGTATAILISALLFAVCHKTTGLATAFLFGLYAGIQFLRTRQLWLSTITHGSYNFLYNVQNHCDLPVRAPGSYMATSTELIILSLAIIAGTSWCCWRLLPPKWSSQPR